MEENTKSKESVVDASTVFDPMKDVDEDVFLFFKSLLEIYNKGLFDPMISFVKADGRILLFLINNGGICHPSKISEGLRLSRPNIAANLRNMEKEGFITRETDKNNRRQVFVKITPAGIARFEEETSLIVRMLSGWLKALGKDKSKTLLDILKITNQKADKLAVKEIGNKKDKDVWEL